MTSSAPSTQVPGAASVEAVLAEIWGELLDIPPASVSPDASFLRLGGDSVLSVRMAAMVRNRLSVVLALSDVTVEITLRELAELVRRRTSGTADAVRDLPVAIERRADTSAPFPLMPLQQGYFVGQHGGWELSYESAHFYGDVGLTGVDGEEAVDALVDALQRLAEHQPMLRARIAPDGRQYVLPLDDPGAVPELRVYDLRTAPPEEVAATLERVRSEMATTGPNPVHGPGLDIRLTLLPGDRARLHTAMSLLVFDGWSSTVLTRELLTLSSDWNAVLRPLEIDFGDYVHALARLPRTEAGTADRDWWWSRLDALPAPPALPLLADPKEVRPTLMGLREEHLSAARWTALRRQCAERDLTPSAAMLAAFAVVLAQWAGHRDLLLNSLQLNRLPLHPDVHRVLGAFASTMLLPIELRPGSTFAELAADAQRVLREHAAHNLVSGVEVSRELARRRGSTRPAGPVVFQSTLGMDAAVGGHPASAGPLGAVSFDDFYHQLRTPQVALEARVYELNDEMAIVFSLVDELFDPAEVDAAFHGLVRLAEELADGPGWDRVPELPEPASPADDGARLRLGRLDAARPAADAGPLRGEAERRVAAIWEDVLDVPVLERGADFFALGGDSLLAVRVLARLAREAGVSLTVRDFLDAPTVAAVAASIADRESR
ncbi:phosphopantetheine-binding protein [Marinactinospora rubrisoli]|uniref:Phosphopantetheine-binding protein n=1 Tax=Marinactinospora rubrisoli TaxID=2715399 RepID=A0ABW2KKU7_9ACTN